jgi:hypothetical protein
MTGLAVAEAVDLAAGVAADFSGAVGAAAAAGRPVPGEARA